jgi:hypothetical protein
VRPRAGPGRTTPRAGWTDAGSRTIRATRARGSADGGQLTFRAVSSTTKLVCSDESSFIRNFTEIVLPL